MSSPETKSHLYTWPLVSQKILQWLLFGADLDIDDTLSLSLFLLSLIMAFRCVGMEAEVEEMEALRKMALVCMCIWFGVSPSQKNAWHQFAVCQQSESVKRYVGVSNSRDVVTLCRQQRINSIIYNYTVPLTSWIGEVVSM